MIGNGPRFERFGTRLAGSEGKWVGMGPGPRGNGTGMFEQRRLVEKWERGPLRQTLIE
jgi:hypothetical protein